jgi:hypothetical protein
MEDDMPYRRMRYSRPVVARKRARYFWVRGTQTNAAPNAVLNIEDLLNIWRTSSGITFNLPDLVIWRILIKISIHFSYSPAVYTAATGVGIGIYVDDAVQTQIGVNSSPYGQRYMMFDMLFAAEQQLMSDPSVAGTPVLYKAYDIKSHRKMLQQDTLYLNINSQGNASITDYSFLYNILIKSP